MAVEGSCMITDITMWCIYRYSVVNLIYFIQTYAWGLSDKTEKKNAEENIIVQFGI